MESELTLKKIQSVNDNMQNTLDSVQKIINKTYLSQLKQMDVELFLPGNLHKINSATDTRIFKIERLVYSNRQSVLESLTSSYTALGVAGYSVFIFLDNREDDTYLYIGTCGGANKGYGQNAGQLLEETFKGHFSGSQLSSLSSDDVDILLDSLMPTNDGHDFRTVSATTGIPSLSVEDRTLFMQGLDRFIDAAAGRKYQALLLAKPIAPAQLDLAKLSYEQMATQLSPLMNQQLSFSEQDSQSVGLNLSENISTSLSTSVGLTDSYSETVTEGTSSTHTVGTSTSRTSTSLKDTVIKGGLMLGAGTVAISGGLPMLLMGGLTGSTTEGSNESFSETKSYSIGKTNSVSNSTTDTFGETKGVTQGSSSNVTTGNSKQISINFSNKSVEQLLKKIDNHLERINEAYTFGGWESAAYFVADDLASSEALASIFLGLMRGSNSSNENFAITTWKDQEKNSVLKWLANLTHPKLVSNIKNIDSFTPATLITSRELAIQLNLPHSSISTVPVIETEKFARSVQILNGSQNGDSIELGKLRHLWQDSNQSVKLNLDQLTGHVFVTGSTGSGKSNTLYEILNQINANNIPFMVIEPAKGEYKHVFANEAHIFGTNPKLMPLLKINPFKFPEQIHVLEHIDRLVEIFNVCWPMYAAMPAILKDAILTAYQNVGFDLDISENPNQSFPTFSDLLTALQQVIEYSAYSGEMKSNYIGSLVTRVKSLTNGLNGQIFTEDEIDNTLLFNSNVIIDLSRMGSQESKSLIMGLLIMRLNEYRMANSEMNMPLKHITVLEEAHNLLKNADISGEGQTVTNKSVEMLSNAIAEMRTYGEGFIIVDQSPNAVDSAAIRNTNTKIIMRLPDEADRQLVGRAAALTEYQIAELSKLPKGVAVVYQNDWLEPVLCKVNYFKTGDSPYHFLPKETLLTRKHFNQIIINYLLQNRIETSSKPEDIYIIQQGLAKLSLNVFIKEKINWVLKQPISDLDFGGIASLIVELFEIKEISNHLVKTATSIEELHINILNLIANKLEDKKPDLLLEIEHCIIKTNTTMTPNVYQLWHDYMSEKGV